MYEPGEAIVWEWPRGVLRPATFLRVHYNSWGSDKDPDIVIHIAGRRTDDESYVVLSETHSVDPKRFDLQEMD